MRPAHQLRYQEFVTGLLHRSLPQTAVDTIIRSIDGEPLPFADPLVVLLLETAGATDLLAYYVNTHGPAATEPASPTTGSENPSVAGPTPPNC